jgi:hypothetical protein
MIDGPPRREVVRKQSPSAAALEHVEDSVEDLARAVETRTSGGFGSGKVGLQAAPFGIRQIGLICFSHARYPTERMPQNPFSDSFRAKFAFWGFSEVRPKNSYMAYKDSP